MSKFIPAPGFLRLPFRFDIQRPRTAVEEFLDVAGCQGEELYENSRTRKPRGAASTTGQNNLSGLYRIRPDESYEEFQREGEVAERGFSQFVPAYAGTYFKAVFDEIFRSTTIERGRLLKKKRSEANPWYRDPEARIDLSVYKNPGAIMVINNRCTHMPADGSVY